MFTRCLSAFCCIGLITLLYLQLQTNEELSRQLQSQSKLLEQKQLQINKCIEVVKKLQIEKSNIEKKEARQKCMQNRLRLGQFVTQRVGATFQENWQDGYAFQEITKYVLTVSHCFIQLPKQVS